jgi:CRISPR-associated protein (Cas_Cmr5)
VSQARIDLNLASDAATLLEQIMRVSDGRIPDEVMSRLKDLPFTLRTAGVPATVAFFAAKSGTDALGRAYGLVGAALRERLRAEVGAPPGTETAIGLLTHLPSVSTSTLQLSFARLAALAEWLRRLAQAVEAERGSPGG